MGKARDTRIEEAVEILEALEGQLRKRHEAMYLAAKFCEERHDPSIWSHDQARYIFATYLDVIRAAISTLKGSPR